MNRNEVGFEILTRTPVPQLPQVTLRPSPPSLPPPSLYYLFYLCSPFRWETTQNGPQGLTCRLTPTQLIVIRLPAHLGSTA